MMRIRSWFHDWMTINGGNSSHSHVVPLLKILFLVQVSQAEVKNFFERACGEVSIVPETWHFQISSRHSGSKDFFNN